MFLYVLKLQINESRPNNMGQYILVQRTPNVAPRASSAPPSNPNTNVVCIIFVNNFHTQPHSNIQVK